MGQIAPMRVPRFLSAVLGSLLFLALAVILLDPIPLFSDIANSVRLRLQLPPATARWQSSGPSSYRIRVKGSVPVGCLVDGELTVHDGRLVDVRMREDPFSPDSPLLPVDPARWQRPGCSYQDLTVESMLERVRLVRDEVQALRAAPRGGWDARSDIRSGAPCFEAPDLPSARQTLALPARLT
jgi:hypothetical protein